MPQCTIDHNDPENIPVALCRTCRPPQEQPLLVVGETEPPASVVRDVAPADGFAQFRVDPEEIEVKIRLEADRRWRQWTATKEHLTRPRKSYFLRQVRKEFY